MSFYYKEDGTIKTDWNTKDVWSVRYLCFDSFVPINYKKSGVTSLTSRAVKLSDLQNKPKICRRLEKL